jgi:hypothetical protein
MKTVKQAAQSYAIEFSGSASESEPLASAFEAGANIVRHWISVDNELPTTGENVLIKMWYTYRQPEGTSAVPLPDTQSEIISIGKYNSHYKFWDIMHHVFYYYSWSVTHWRYIDYY